MKYTKLQHNDSRHHHHHHHHHHGRGGSDTGGSSTSGSRISMSLSSSSSKRGKKHNWGTRERSGMSFLIVIAFFAVFGLIILTEVFMIDERAHGGMMMMRSGGGYGGRFGDSMPDYDNVKDDYDLLEAGLLNDNKLGFVQLHDNKFKIQDAGESNNGGSGRLAGVLLNSQNGGNAYAGAGLGGGTGLGSASQMGGNGPLIPWGKMLPSKIEESLPRFPIGSEPTDGSWQIVNGTRFKFFVFSAYYDRRDGAKLVRIVGATKTRGPERVWCRFWYVNKNATTATWTNTGGGGKPREKYTSVTVMARVKVIRENWSLKYSACFVLCPVRPQEYDVPQYVSIVARLRAPPGNLLELRNTDWDRDFTQMRETHTNNQTSSNGVGGKSTTITTMPSMRFKLHPQKQRSKYICRPEAVVEAGNHFVWEYAPGKGSLNVPPTDGILQHYRVCEFGGNDCIKAPSIVDRTTNKYINRLVERVLTVYRYLKTKCDLPELPPIPKPQTPKPEMKPIIRKDTGHNEPLVAKRKDVMTKRILENKKLDKKTDIKRDNEMSGKAVMTQASVTAAKDPNKVAGLPIKSVSVATTIQNPKSVVEEPTTLNVDNKTNKTTIAIASLTTSGHTGHNSSLTNTSTNPTTSSTMMTTSTTTTTTTISTTKESSSSLDLSTVKKSHKVVVFFVDDKGKPRARLEYH
ncbi:uncharacterized protein LOC142224498 [Haematobia irritans]|uniref:uncharacterized protein LOC142224498 n=1 Tax=Haematobia irritans TaxID=7368 RepID=UPI003F50544C